MQLAREGAAVGIVDIDEAGGRDTVQRLNDTGAPAHFHYGDITDFAAVESAFAEIAATLGPVTLLVNNAAFTEAGSAFDPAVAARLKACIYSRGDSVEPGAAFRAFRGRDARIEPMLRGRGLIA